MASCFTQRIEVRETDMASFIIRGGTLAMTVRRDLYLELHAANP
jgi:hypothetical protein